MATQRYQFYLSHSLSALSLGVNPFEFLDEPYIAKTRVLGLDFVIIDGVALIQYQSVTDRQKEGRAETDMPP